MDALLVQRAVQETLGKESLSLISNFTSPASNHELEPCKSMGDLQTATSSRERHVALSYMLAVGLYARNCWIFAPHREPH